MLYELKFICLVFVFMVSDNKYCQNDIKIDQPFDFNQFFNKNRNRSARIFCESVPIYTIYCERFQFNEL